MSVFPSPCCGKRSRVLDSRPSPEGIRRRRECEGCLARFSTYETAKPPEAPRFPQGHPGSGKLRPRPRRITPANLRIKDLDLE